MLKEREKKHKPGKDKEDRRITLTILICLFLTSIFFCTNLSIALAEDPNKYVTKDVAKDVLFKLNELEEKIFHHKFENEQANQRINRLEEFIFSKKHDHLTLEKRIEKLTRAINLEKLTIENETKLTDTLKPQKSTEEKGTPKVIYDESFNVGIVGTVSQMEFKVFGQTFNNLPFEKRIENLEEKILPRLEINKNKKKSLIERVTYLVQRINPTQDYTPQSYTIDLNSSYLINEKTREVIRDISGNPIYVKIPSQLLRQNIEENITRELIPPEYQLPNQFPYGNLQDIYKQNLPPYGKDLQPTKQIPPELFFNPNNIDIGGDEDY